VVWTEAETLWFYRRDWLGLFVRHSEAIRQKWMCERERTTLASLPVPVTIYRGYNKPHAKIGLSWSLRRDVARKVPTCGWRGHENPWLVTAQIDPRTAIAYLDARDEQEVIVRPSDIQVISDERIRPFTDEERARIREREMKRLGFAPVASQDARI
jgi:hypothetical protein